MSRKTYVQHPETRKMVPLAEVDWDRHRTRGAQNFQIMPDIEPFVSTVDGSVITSRSRLRSHNERHGVVNFHEFDGHWEEKAKERNSLLDGTSRKAREDRAMDIAQAMEHTRSAPTDTIDDLIPGD